MPTKPDTAAGRAATTSSHTARSAVDGQQQQREAGDADDRRPGQHQAPAPLGHQAHVEQQGQGVPTQRNTKSAGPSAPCQLAELVHGGRADHHEVGDRHQRRRDRRRQRAPGVEHVVVTGAPGGVAGRRDRLAQPGDEGDEEHAR